MTVLKKQKLWFFLFLFGFFSAAWFVQQQLFLNWDVSWLMLAADRLLTGGTYVQDFFESNPPLILYLYLLPLIGSQWFSVNTALMLQLYVFLLVCCSLYLSFKPLKMLLSDEGPFQMRLFFLASAAIMLVLPGYDFGEREHLLIILTLPYLFLAVCRLENKTPQVDHAMMIGVFAGLGFCIKPHFLLTPLLIEAYFMAYKKSVLTWLRTETMIMGSVALIYLIMTLVCFPDYITFIIPFVLRVYSYAEALPWRLVLTGPTFLFCCLAFMLYPGLGRRGCYKNWTRILLLALLGFLSAYLLQRNLHYYHIYPALSLAILLWVFYFGLLTQRINLNAHDYFNMLLILAYLFFVNKSIWTALVFHPQGFFCYFGTVFLILLYRFQTHKNIFKVLACVLVIVLVSLYGSFLAERTIWHSHAFEITMLILMSLYLLFIGRLERSLAPRRNASLICNRLFITLLSVFVFAYPAYLVVLRYDFGLNFKTGLALNLGPFAQASRQPLKVYLFDSIMASAFINLHSPQIAFVSRFPLLWPVAGLANQAEQFKNPAALAQMRKDKQLVMDMIVADLKKNRPDLIFVDVSVSKQEFKVKNFDYLKYFMEDEGFRVAWLPYHYLMTLENQGHYKMKVYKRT